MQQTIIQEDGGETPGSVKFAGPPVALEILQCAVNRLIRETDSGNSIVAVSVDGEWCTLTGTVASQKTRTALFALVPRRNGRRCIVDRLLVACGDNHNNKGGL